MQLMSKGSNQLYMAASLQTNCWSGEMQREGPWRVLEGTATFPLDSPETTFSVTCSNGSPSATCVHHGQRASGASGVCSCINRGSTIKVSKTWLFIKQAVLLNLHQTPHMHVGDLSPTESQQLTSQNIQWIYKTQNMP